LKPLGDVAEGVCLFKRSNEKLIFLMLVLNGFHVRSFLSKGQNDPSVEVELLEAVPNFGTIYS
jgi:hypothetical protein